MDGPLLVPRGTTMNKTLSPYPRTFMKNKVPTFLLFYLSTFFTICVDRSLPLSNFISLITIIEGPHRSNPDARCTQVEMDYRYPRDPDHERLMEQRRVTIVRNRPPNIHPFLPREPDDCQPTLLPGLFG